MHDLVVFAVIWYLESLQFTRFFFSCLKTHLQSLTSSLFSYHPFLTTFFHSLTMPSVNTLITAIVAGLAIGVHAGPCRPHGSSSSVSTVEVVTTTSAEPSTTTFGSYPDVSSNSETKTTGTTSITGAYETKTTQSSSVTSSSFTVSETTTDVGAHGSSESETTSTTAVETTSTTAIDTTSTTSKVETTSTSAQDTTTVPSTTSSTAAPSTTSSTTAPSSTTANESTTQETTTLETRTSAASTTTSAAPSQTSGSSCPPAANLVCGKTGYLGDDSSSHLLDLQRDTDLEACKTQCKENDSCVTIGHIADTNQCELYDASPATLELNEDPDSWYAVYEACCFE